MKEEFPVGQPGDVVDFKNLLNSLVPIAIGIVSFFIKEKRKRRNSLSRIIDQCRDIRKTCIDKRS
jgi:hypothetical protein